MAAFERNLIIATLERYHYSINRTAEHLKVTRHALRYRMQRLNIQSDAEADDDAEGGGKEGPGGSR